MPSIGLFYSVLPSCRAEGSAPWPECPRVLCPKAAVSLPSIIGDLVTIAVPCSGCPSGEVKGG